MIYVDANIIMEDLCVYLNKIPKKDNHIHLGFDFKLLADIKEFFMSKQETDNRE